jgi:hypothetical protein
MSSSIVDVNCFIGPYPYRHVPHPNPEVLTRVLGREGVARAWVGHLPSAFHRDPSHGNAELFALLEPFSETLKPVPAIRPDWPGWEEQLGRAFERGARAVRTYPQHYGLAPGDASLTALARAVAARRGTLVLTVRFEDSRQRHLLDRADDLSAAHVRELARAGTGARLLVTAAGRDTIEEVHWGLTPAERSRVYYDISWIWGPPTDDLVHLVRTVGADRLVYGSMWPLRLSQLPRANVALLELEAGPQGFADTAQW